MMCPFESRADRAHRPIRPERGAAGRNRFSARTAYCREASEATTSDRWLGDLALVEGKGAVTKEVDAALLTGAADLAVHCVKDIWADRPLPAGTVFATSLAPDDIRDGVVHLGGLTLDELQPGARVGTSSVRRRAQLATFQPYLEWLPMRGNVNRSLARLAAGEADALILAVAGLERMGAATPSAR